LTAYLASQQRFDPKNPNSVFVNQKFLTLGVPLPILPFTLPVAANFQYAYAQQGNLTIEQQLWHNYKFSVSYTYTHGSHLNRPRDIDSTNPLLLVNNFRNALAAGQTQFSNPLTVTAPAIPVGATASTCGIMVIAPNALGKLTGFRGNSSSRSGRTWK